MWGYYWGYTAAQIELMAIDQPIVVYNHEKKQRKKGDKPEFKKASALDILRTQMKYEQSQREQQGKPITINFGTNTNTNT